MPYDVSNTDQQKITIHPPYTIVTMLLNRTIPWNYIAGKVRKEMMGVVLYAVVVAVLQSLYNLHHISVPLSVPMILGTVISLLLAFRSNQAYDRWWEARIIWGAIVNDSRTLTRQWITFLGTALPADVERQFFLARLVKRQAAWCYCLGQSLRRINDHPHSERLMTRKEWNFVVRHSNMPNSILKLHAKDIRQAYEDGWINEFQQVKLDETVMRLCDSMGKCERIKNTIFPSTYSLYIHFAIILFIALLPFSLVEYFGWVEVPIVAAIAACFLLIEKMAIHLQDPFENKPTDTPMTTISRTIERDLMQMIEDEKQEDEAFEQIVQQIDDHRFYVM